MVLPGLICATLIRMKESSKLLAACTAQYCLMTFQALYTENVQTLYAEDMQKDFRGVGVGEKRTTYSCL